MTTLMMADADWEVLPVGTQARLKRGVELLRSIGTCSASTVGPFKRQPCSLGLLCTGCQASLTDLLVWANDDAPEFGAGGSIGGAVKQHVEGSGG